MRGAARTLFGFFWAVSTAFLAYLAYIIIQTEHDPRVIWGWLTLCGLTFVGATLLASTAFLAAPPRRE
ncbi:MAG TPA: hypothetical protein PK523_05585 [Elusimicrobiales bacterium]|nr:hypothetical protein [Elusimicrobiales bacterium]